MPNEVKQTNSHKTESALGLEPGIDAGGLAEHLAEEPRGLELRGDVPRRHGVHVQRRAGPTGTATGGTVLQQVERELAQIDRDYVLLLGGGAALHLDEGQARVAVLVPAAH